MKRKHDSRADALEAIFAELYRRGWTQAAIADRVGVPRQRVNEWASGKHWPRAHIDDLAYLAGVRIEIVETIRLEPC